MKPLSYGAFALFFLYGSLALRVLLHNPGEKLNRLIALLLADFTIWALYSTFSMALEDQGTAMLLYRWFSVVWHMFPGIALHIALVLLQKDRLLPPAALYPLIYLPGMITAWTYYHHVVTGLEMNRWYLMSVLDTSSVWFFVYNGYLLLFMTGTISLLLLRGRLSSLRRIRMQSRWLGWTMFVSFALGMISNALLPALGVEFPFIAIYWNAVWAAGLFIAVTRYGFSRLNASLAVDQILHHIGEFIIILDSAGAVFTASRFFCRVMNRGEGDLRGRSFSGIIGDADFFTRVRGALGDGREHYREELLVGEVPSVMHVSPISSAEGELFGYLCVGHDIRHYRKMRQTLRSFEDFVRNALDGIILTDEKGVVSHWNRGMELITGVPEERMAGRSILEAVPAIVVDPPMTGEAMAALDLEVGKALERGTASWAGELNNCGLRGAAGDVRSVHIKAFLIPAERGHFLSCIVRDVTDYQRIQEERIDLLKQLSESQRLRTIGTLTGGLAHNFNNILGGMFGAISLLRGALEQAPGMEEPLDKVEILERLSDRGAAIVRQLLSIAGENRMSRGVMDLVPVIDSVLLMGENSFDRSVSIRKIVPESAFIVGNRSEVEQMLFNIALNGVHAMTIMRPEGGERRGGVLTVSLVSSDRFHSLTIRDEGVGMNAEMKEQIFDPFFSTKEEGLGYGFGLAMVRRVVQDMGAEIEVASEPGQGSSFTIHFPAAPADTAVRDSGGRAEGAEDAQEAEERTPAGSADPGTLTVLVVDDEEMIRRTTARMLEHAGYRVIAADGGREALALLDGGEGSVDLVLLDLMMPGLSGVETLEAIRERAPRLPVLLASGGITSRINHPVIAKPYTMDELVRRVDAMTGAVRTPARP